MASGHRVNLLERYDYPIWERDLQTGHRQWDPRTYQLFGLPADCSDDPVKVWARHVHPDDLALVEQAMRDCIDGGTKLDVDFRVVWPDGSIHHLHSAGRVLSDAQGRPTKLIGVDWDVTPLRELNARLAEQHELLRVTLHSIGDAVITTDAQSEVTWLNPAAERMTGWLASEAAGRPLTQVFHIVNEETRLPAENPVTTCLAQGSIVGLANHTVLISRNGEEFGIEDSAAPIRNPSGEVLGVVLVFHDVTEQRRLSGEMSYRATHDALTGLVNRAEFETRLRRTLERAHEERSEHALLYIDLDQFKVVNDTCGHQAGDRLLRDVTGLLQTRVRMSDTIARLGGDEFGVLLEDCTLAQATRIAEGVRQSIRDYRFIWGTNTMSVGASVGVVEIKRDTENVASIMTAADIACYTAKDGGRNRIHVYDPNGVSARHREMHWVARIARAVEENRLEIFFQPIVATAVAHPRHFYELTVRLRGEDGQLVPPGEFIPAAERYNAMAIIDQWMVASAVDLLSARQRSGTPLPLIAVNVSGTSLNEQTFLGQVLAHVGDAEIASALCFEITETAAVTNLADAINFMRELKARGCKFSLDDFGSGLSSFMYLKTLPVDFLKIDGQFVGQIATSPVDRSMVEAIAKVGKALGIATVAECVESREVLEELERMGVDYAQGHYLAMPQPIMQLP